MLLVKLSVGNEFLLNSYGDGGSPTDPDGVQGRQDLLEAIQWVNSSIQDMGLDKHIPIGTADAVRGAVRPCAGSLLT